MPETTDQTDPIPAPEAPQELDLPMLDVHPPHEPVHGIRDFLLHIFTITIGLLIALSLEAGVEYMHHRHIVAEARENIRHEIELNDKQLADNLKSVQADEERITTDLETIRALRAHPKDFHGALHYTMSWSSFNDSAWRSSRDMGALTYMPYEEVQRYADLYGQQQIVNEEAIRIFTRQSLAVAPMLMEKDPADLPPAETLTMLRETAGLSLSLDVLKQILQNLDGSYTEVLKKK